MFLKLALCLGLLCLGVGWAGAQSPLSKLERVSLYGYDYHRLDDWARANGFSLRWVVPNSQVRAVKGSSVLEFAHDSRRMSLNGVDVWLSVPVAVRGGAAHVSALDFRTVIHPILFPVRDPVRQSIKTIVLDPGHGGEDPGNREGARQEKAYTLLLARELRAVLVNAGFRVSLTRNSDTTLQLTDRPRVASRHGADLLVSLHFNSADRAGAAGVQGIETYAMTPAGASSTNARGEGAGTGAFRGNRQDAKNVLLAYHVQRALVRQLPAADRGVRRARFVVLRDATMPAVLVEAGFMTNVSDSRRIYDPAQRRRIAAAIADGILTYRALVEGAKSELRSP